MPKKENNIRKYPGESQPRPDKAKFKREEAAERQAAYDKLSIEEKIAKLGKHTATKQRAKLAAALEKPKGQKEPEPMWKRAGFETEEAFQEYLKNKPVGEPPSEHKHMKAKDRRKQERE